MQRMRSPLSVRGFTKWSEEDSDDEDKLHIVEEDSILDSVEEKPPVFNLSSAKQLQKRDTLHDCSPDTSIQEIKVKEECVTDEEQENGQINETLCQKKTGVICPDIPDMEQHVPKEEVHDEYGTSDELSQHYSCPYCSRGYKRHTALKEHIKLRHKKNDDLCCSLCSYTFTYRTQLDRHMNAHKNGKEQVAAKRIVSHLGVNRKFKCTECSKAFKYKHHLKEHLRIHSGEKPYECSNCKKRFSHSGSYSSHISSKKCVAIPPAGNCLSQDAGSKIEVKINNNHLGEELHSKKIKEEPDEHEPEPEPVKTTTPVVTTTTITSSTTNNEGGISIQSFAPQGVVQTLVLPTVSLVQPININLQDLQNMLKLSVDGNIMLQAVGSANVNRVSGKVIHPGQLQTQAIHSLHPHLQVISAISLPVLDQDGNSKIIINCSVDSQVSTSDQNTAPSILTYQTVEPKKVVDTNRAPAELGEFKSAQCLKLAEPNTTQLNVTPTQKLPTSRPVPTQISIIKSKQSAALNKTSIIKVTKLIPGQTKFSQPAMLLLRTVNRPQGLVVKQLAVANPKVTVGTTDSKTTSENTTMVANQNSLTELDQVAEVTSTSRDKHQPKDRRTSLLQRVNLKTETMNKIKEDCEAALQIQKERERKEEVTPQSESTMAHSSVICGDGFHNYATCLFCDNSPSSTDALNCLNSIEQGSHRSLSSLLGEEDSSQQPPMKSLLPLLEAYSKDSHPSEEQLSQVAKFVNLPRDVVSRWFQKMQLKNILLNYSENPQNEQQTTDNFQPKPNMGTQTQILNPSNKLYSVVSLGQKNNPSSLSYSANDFDMIKKEEMEEKGQVEPLDLSLPKSFCLNGTTSVTGEAVNPSVPTQKEPLNLTSFRKETLNGNTIFVTQSTNPINIIATPLPTLVAIEEPGGIPCLKAAISTKQHTILIPQLSYTYTSPSADGETNTYTFSRIKTSTITTSTATDIHELDSCEMTNAGDERKGLNDSSLSPVKKRRKMYGGQYACDLCDKCFQKSSSLLRHKFEHTGKRPYECGICKKAFKHKHHLIEHSRLHSGEKPYQCDKCGKRFSHSGSYSQHMNHRYSYCKKVYDQLEPNNASSRPPLQLDSDERESEDEEEIDDYKEPEEEKDGEEDLFGFDMSDIKVVRIGQEYDEKEGELRREEKEKVTEMDIIDLETLEKDVVKTLGIEEQIIENKTVNHIVKPIENKVFNDSTES